MSGSEAILLLMIRNESRIIERCIRSAAAAATAICLCDTGSTDNTIEVALATAASLQKPIKVYQHEWKNFGHNRTLSFQACQDYCQALGKSLASTYALAIDGDMVLQGDTGKIKSLTDTGYYLLQKAGNLEYKNMRFLRLDYPWTCKGATHEYWDGTCRNEEVAGIWIDDRNDGGCKANKFPRDEKLLLEDLEADPINPRTHFYLAQTYRCMGEREQAIEWYKKRTELGGWYEEVWYSMFQICKLYLEKGQPEDAEYWAEKAHKYNSYRAEAYYLMCKHFREVGKHWKAMHYYIESKKITKPPVALFVETDVYDYLLDFEYTCIQYYVSNQRQVGLHKSIDYYNYPIGPHRNVVYNNMEFYVEQPSGTEITPLKFPECGDFVPSSVAIIFDKERARYRYNVRYVNYSINPNGSYSFRDPEIVCRTRNAISYMGEEERVEFIPDSIDLPKVQTNIYGLEDIRLFKCNERLYYTASSREYTDKIRVVCGVYDSTLSESRVLLPPFETACEKNWLGINGCSEPTFVYGWHPLRIGVIGENNVLKITHTIQTPHIFEHFRGSTPLYKSDNLYWCIVHFVKYVAQPRKYYHAIVFLDAETYRVKMYSLPFVFEKVAIEYCLGAYMEEECLNAVFSRNDSNPAIAKIPIKSLTMLGV